MNDNSTKQPSKFARFLRNHAALLLLIFCALAITTVVLVVTLTDDGAPDTSDVVKKPNDDTPTVNPDDNKDKPSTPVTEKVYFVAPLEFQKVSMGYCDSKEMLFVFNKTLNSWHSHGGLDLTAADGSKVCAMYGGTVVDVGSTYGMGNYVKIDHGDNVVATYASLSDVKVVKGQEVKLGEEIGAASTSASYEFADGAHLHLEVTKDGKAVDPTPYVDGEIYREVTKESKN